MSRYLLRPLVVLFAIATLGVSPAGPDRAPIEPHGWTTAGPVTGGFLQVAADAGRHDTLYAQTAGRGLLRSDDGGDHWRSIDRSQNPVERFWGFGAAPGASGVLYAFFVNSVYRSADFGETWTHQGDVPAAGFIESFAAGLVVDPVRPSTVYAPALLQSRFSQSAQLFVSDDAGVTWRQLPLGDASLIRRLLIDPRNPSRLYTAPGQGLPIERSLDGGATWTSVGDAGTFDVAANPDDFDTVYAAIIPNGTDQIHVSRDAGITWSAFPAPPGNFVVTVAGVAGRPGRVYAVNQTGLYRTDDAGASWALIHASSSFGRLALDPANPRTSYFEGQKSADDGLTWATLPTGDIASYVTTLARSPASPSTIFAAGNGDGGVIAVFRTDDDGASWRTLRTGLPSLGGALSAVAVDPADPARAFAGVSGLDRSLSAGLFETDTGGAVWFPSGSGLPDGGVLSLLADPTNGRVLYARTFQGVYRSDDGGGTFAQRNEGLPSVVDALIVDPIVSSHLWAAGSHEIFESFNGAGSWTAFPVVVANLPDSTLNSVTGLAADPRRPSVLWGIGPAGALRSADGGRSWAVVASNYSGNEPFTAIAVDPADPRQVFIGTYLGRVLRSSDDGASWFSYGRGLPSFAVSALLADGEGPGRLLHAATLGAGIWEIPIEAGRAPRTRVVSPR